VTLGLSRNWSVGESKVIRLLSIIHNGIILDLVCGFFAVVEVVRVVVPSLSFGRNLVVYIQPYQSRDLSRKSEMRTLLLVRFEASHDPGPHGLSSYNLIGPGRSNDKPTDPHTAQPLNEAIISLSVTLGLSRNQSVW